MGTLFLHCSLFFGSLIILMIAVLVRFFFVGINGINVGVQNLATDEYITISAFWAFEPLGPLKTPQPCGLATSVFAVDGVNFSERPIDSC